MASFRLKINFVAYNIDYVDDIPNGKRADEYVYEKLMALGADNIIVTRGDFTHLNAVTVNDPNTGRFKREINGTFRVECCFTSVIDGRNLNAALNKAADTIYLILKTKASGRSDIKEVIDFGSFIVDGEKIDGSDSFVNADLSAYINTRMLANIKKALKGTDYKARLQSTYAWSYITNTDKAALLK